MTITPVLLAGGSGTRLWPVSRKSFPKQFAPLIGEESLFQASARRLSGARYAPPLVMTNADFRFIVAEQLDQIGIAPAAILIEPAGRNTAPAILAAALSVSERDPDAVLLVAPSDHVVPDAEGFGRAVDLGLPAAQAGRIVTFGITPTRPETGYGYMEAEGQGQGPLVLKRFIEKPDAHRAQELLLQGRHFWNAGIFLAQAGSLLQALEAFAPDILAACRQAVAAQEADGDFLRLESASFSGCRSESIDYAVMEKARNVAVVPFAGAWSDVGSWNAVAELTVPDPSGNRIEGHGHAVQASNTYIHAPHRPVVALGTQNVLIIDTADAVLVADAAHVEQVKHVVAELERQGVPQAQQHRRVARPWGMYDSVDSGARFQVKRIVVKPGASLSLQMHHHRAEHWVVVSGTAEVTNGDKVLLLSENQSTYIPIGQIHRLANPGKVPLEIIEVQSGAYLGEDDIVRLQDTYGRVAGS